jgi:PAS domain S-box-containing protein
MQPSPDELEALQRRLAELEERYAVLAELGSEWAYIYYLQPDGSSQQLWSGGAFEQITGHDKDDINARDAWRDIVHPDDLPIVKKRTEELLAGREDTSEYRILTRNGATRWVCKRSRPTAQDDGTMLVYCIVRDITDAKQAEYDQRRLLAQERVHSAVLEIASSEDLPRITSQIASELKALNIQFAGVGLNLIDEEAYAITAYDIYDNVLEYQATTPVENRTDVDLIKYWQRDEVWERTPDEDFENLIVETKRSYYHPAVIIDVPFLRGTLAVGLTQGTLGQNANLIALLQSFCRSLSLAFQRIQDTAKRSALQEVREAVWKMHSEEDLLQVIAVVEQSLRSTSIAFRGCAIHTVDTSTSPPQVHTHRKSSDNEEWIHYDTLPKTMPLMTKV